MNLVDPFAILGLPRRADLDARDVQKAYLARSAALHPDLHGIDVEFEEQSARLNQARQTLLDIEQRLTALWRLELASAAAAGADISTIADDKTLPQAFLMEMMETREAIDEATRTRDTDAIARWEHWALDQRRQYSAQVAALLDALASTPDKPKMLRTIKQQFNAWRYIERLLEQLAGQQPM